MKKKFINLFITAVFVFIGAFAFAGCADHVQSNCNHTWVLQKNSTLLRDATCYQEGISEVYNCAKCQKTRFEYSPKTPHTFNEADNVIQYSCNSSSTYVKQKCTVCEAVITATIPFTVHKLGDAEYHDAYEATLVDIGLYTQEEYDKLASDVIESEKISHMRELQEKSHCDYLERKCEDCDYSLKLYGHRLDEVNEQEIDDMREEALKTGNCGSTISLDCIFCGQSVQYFCHNYEEAEIVYSSSEIVIYKYPCTLCHSEEQYEAVFVK